ncbi:NAD(P)-dependent dehydrogenase (short-subunit alcohol dehydrogenase family) [Algoriphagus sp. 4150]|uniref:SDR family NAD(P)-dependent oxidoreductase n=1 Tax=Algoriphagus sp. 4150 TaxID=2817756 RepID=UPI00285E6810|nr:SDR family NAD(P)-dependent oxidoreductase [Algoriphagus sp. 4150]MDR7131818.1 NAD(P)-dependent dehydrogenase (short-subunit alcohol dehydrogenase family) [Algoriphagus sp. 4150]
MQSQEKGTHDSSSPERKLVALVTGANKGIGFQIAKALAEKGYIVYVGSRNPQNGLEAVKEIGAEAKEMQLDVTDKRSITAAVSKIQGDFGRLDLLVNNAAISNTELRGRNLLEALADQRASVASLDEVRAVWETNVFGVLAVSQAFLPLLKCSASARIVNVSSALGSLTLNMDTSNPHRYMFDMVYGASKTALNALTVSFAIELENLGIKVNAVSPGFASTALNNFEGTVSVEEGSSEPIRVALEEDGPSGIFTGPDGVIVPW